MEMFKMAMMVKLPWKWQGVSFMYWQFGILLFPKSESLSLHDGLITYHSLMCLLLTWGIIDSFHNGVPYTHIRCQPQTRNVKCHDFRENI